MELTRTGKVQLKNKILNWKTGLVTHDCNSSIKETVLAPEKALDQHGEGG